MALTRMWVNQPSKLQPFHELHGVNVLAEHEYDDTMRVYFLSGSVISQQMPRLCLSNGWKSYDITKVSPLLKEQSCCTGD